VLLAIGCDELCAVGAKKDACGERETGESKNLRVAGEKILVFLLGILAF